MKIKIDTIKRECYVEFSNGWERIDRMQDVYEILFTLSGDSVWIIKDVINGEAKERGYGEVQSLGGDTESA
jgi:hypothetical protein